MNKKLEKKKKIINIFEPTFGNRIKSYFYSRLISIRPTILLVLLKRCLLVGRKYVKTSTGHIFWIDPLSEFGIIILKDRIYELQMTRLLQLVLRSGDTFIDVGGYEGYFSIIASSLISDGQIHCIEPQSRLQEVIRENMRINNASLVKIHKIVLSEKEGKTELFLAPSTVAGNSSIDKHYRMWFVKEKVFADTIDSFFKKNNLSRARLLKIDTEGSEYCIIKGAYTVLSKQAIDFIALEYHPGLLSDEEIIRTHEILKNAGYILTQINRQTIYHLRGLEKEMQGLGDLRVDINLERGSYI
ncbi:FkbM family methyltransferase [bacterium]|nr:MAG: FkbM family methyltransferase [bacterium]